MDPSLLAFVAFLNSVGIVGVRCQREYDPPLVAVTLLGGTILLINYSTYQLIYDQIGQPADICDPANEG